MSLLELRRDKFVEMMKPLYCNVRQAGRIGALFILARYDAERINWLVLTIAAAYKSSTLTHLRYHRSCNSAVHPKHLSSQFLAAARALSGRPTARAEDSGTDRFEVESEHPSILPCACRQVLWPSWHCIWRTQSILCTESNKGPQ